MIVDLSEALQKKIIEGLEGKTSCVFDPEIILENPDTGFKYKVDKWQGLGITCDFMTAYCDMYQLNFEADLINYIAIIENLNNMEVFINLHPVNPIYLKEEEEGIIQLHLRVLVNQQVDLKKKFNINMFGDTNDTNDGRNTPMTVAQAQVTLPLCINMIEMEVFDLRHVQINAIFNAITQEKLLHWLCQQFKAEKTHITTPDNSASYDNLIIPPMQDISNVFNFLQERYGIFKDGLGYYFTNKTMYIYPLYSHNRDRSTEKGIVHIVNAPDDYFLGMDRYHAMHGDDIVIISVTKKDQNALGSQGVENDGNVHVSTNADVVKDQFVQVQKDGTVQMNKSPVTILALANTANNMQADAMNVKFQGERNNLYPTTTQFSAIDGSILGCGWSHSYPGLIKPGQIATYHFDGQQGEYQTQNGTILQITYAGSPFTSDHGDEKWMVFNTNIVVHLESDEKSEDQVQVLQV